MSGAPRLFRYRNPGLTLQLLLFFILPLAALVLAVALGSQALHQQAMRQIVGERDGRTARLAAEMISHELSRRADIIERLAREAAADNALIEGPDSPYSEFDGGIASFDSSGGLLQGEIAGWNSPAMKSFIVGVGEQASFSSLIADSVSGKEWVIVAASGIGGVAVAGAFSPKGVLDSSFAGIFDPRSIAVFVIGPAREMIYQIGVCRSSASCTEHPGVGEALAGKGGITYVSGEGGEHVMAYEPVPPAGWALVIEEPWEEIDNPSLRATQYAPLVLIPALFLALAALWFGVRRIEQPLKKLEAKASDLTWGRYDTIDQAVGGIDEIRRLQTELIHLARKVKTAQQSLHGYIGAITAGQEEERRRLARELHDSTLQALIALNQRVQLAKLNSTEKNTAEALTEIQILLDQTMTELRRFTRALRPIYLEDLGLVAALETLAREVGQSSSAPVKFIKTGSERRIASEVELALYRLAQEALSNAARHSRASHIDLSIDYAPEKITLAVSDDGIGFTVPENPAEFVSEGHFGLLGMHERAELIGGFLEIRSIPGKETRVAISVPL